MNIIVNQIYWYISHISGERLQDHWSSGYCSYQSMETKSCEKKKKNNFIFQINSNGNLNFEGSSSLSGWKNQDVIAPFWDDLHPGNKQPGQGHIYYRETTDPDILSVSMRGR